MNSTLVHGDINEFSIRQKSDITRQIKGPTCRCKKVLQIVLYSCQIKIALCFTAKLTSYTLDGWTVAQLENIYFETNSLEIWKASRKTQQFQMLMARSFCKIGIIHS